MIALKNVNINVDVDNPIFETAVAMELITKLAKKNKISFDLTISYDFATDDMGFYLPNSFTHKHKIFINPHNCKSLIDADECFDEPFYHGYTADITIFGVTIHEFSHYLSMTVFPNMLKDFRYAFPTTRLYLNDYSNNDLRDELAEILTIYITNPYLLKLISKNHWEFCKNYFKSPVACSVKKCYEIYQDFPVHVKEHMAMRWGYIYNICSEKFEHAGDE